MTEISSETARVADQKTAKGFAEISQRHGPLDPLAALELHRSLWRSHAGADVVRVVPADAMKS